MPIKDNERKAEIQKYVEEALRGIQRPERFQHVSVEDLSEVAKIMRELPPLTYPINSASDFIKQLGGSRTSLEVEGVRTHPARMMKYMPAHYFPVASEENLVEKMAELIRKNRKPVTNILGEVAALKKQLPKLEYPISSREQFAGILERKKVRKVRVLGSEISTAKMIDQVPLYYFPISSEEELYHKIAVLIGKRPLIVKD